MATRSTNGTNGTGGPVSASRAAWLAVTVAALGYFVDIYDLILFSMVRKPSLVGLGVCGKLETSSAACDEILKQHGIYLINMQMGGMLLGGILWGMLGDKRGRLSVLFGSITLYSIANIANGMVHTVDSYAVWRLLAGIGLAGELGAGITLVSELMGKEKRGIGTTVVAAFGVSGGLLAGIIGGAFPSIPHPEWRTAYFIGGGLGLALLVMRIGVAESGMYKAAASDSGLSRGNFFRIFTSARRVRRFLAIIAVGIPVWFVIGIPVTFADAIGRALGMTPPPAPATAAFCAYGGAALGGLASGLISHWIKSRKRTLGIFLASNVVAIAVWFTLGASSLTAFYIMSFVAGAATGYWSVFISMAAELFGTNMRATVTTSVPNFVRGSLPLLTLSWKALQESMSLIAATVVVGAGALALAVAGLASLDETFAVDLDFHERD
ncbi:MAG TPA: MFS transporter [Kofleriaceae bacterium]|nr:MFS transporter [Kofleriaceae bacterium]